MMMIIGGIHRQVLFQFEHFGADMLIGLGWQCCQMVHRGCDPFDSFSVVHRRLLSCAKTNEARHASLAVP